MTGSQQMNTDIRIKRRIAERIIDEITIAQSTTGYRSEVVVNDDIQFWIENHANIVAVDMMVSVLGGRIHSAVKDVNGAWLNDSTNALFINGFGGYFTITIKD